MVLELQYPFHLTSVCVLSVFQISTHKSKIVENRMIIYTLLALLSFRNNVTGLSFQRIHKRQVLAIARADSRHLAHDLIQSRQPGFLFRSLSRILRLRSDNNARIAVAGIIGAVPATS